MNSLQDAIVFVAWYEGALKKSINSVSTTTCATGTEIATGCMLTLVGSIVGVFVDVLWMLKSLLTTSFFFDGIELAINLLCSYLSRMYFSTVLTVSPSLGLRTVAGTFASQ